MKELDDDIIGLMSRRAFDVAGSSRGVKVYLNGKVLPVGDHRLPIEYVKFFRLMDSSNTSNNTLRI